MSVVSAIATANQPETLDAIKRGLGRLSSSLLAYK